MMFMTLTTPSIDTLAAPIALLLGACLLAACDRTPEGAIAQVGGQWVTQQDFDAYLQHKRITPRGDAQRERVLDDYLARLAMASAIEDIGLESQALIEAELAENRREILISRYFDSQLKDAVTDAQVRAHYDANLEQYSSQRVHVAHVLNRTNRSMSDNERRAKLTSLREVHAKLIAGEDFEALAKRFSEDVVSGKKGGDLGWISPDSIAPEFASTVADLEPGQFSGPVQTKFGYHIIKLIDGPQVQQRPFEAVKGEIRYRLRTDARQRLSDALDAKIEIKRVGDS